MKITKIMAAAAIAAITMFSSCRKVEKLGPAALNLDQVEVSFEAVASSKTLTFTSTRDWTATVSVDAQDWLSVDPAEGNGSNDQQTITIQVLENTGYDRSATITVNLLSGAFSLDSKVITVTQSGQKEMTSHAGTKEDPYTPAEALAIINAGEHTANEVFIAGKISRIDTGDNAPGNSFGNANYWISEDGTSVGELKIYRGYGLGGAWMTTADYIKVGDEVIVAGVLELFGGNTPEVGQGSYIYSLNGTVKEKGADDGSESTEGAATKEGNVITFEASKCYHVESGAGAWTIASEGISLYVSSGILGNMKEYRIYKYNTLTITSTVGNIEKVEFTCTASGTNNYGPGNFTVTDGTYTHEDKTGTWIGNAASITFTASNAQVRATTIAITIAK